MSVNTPYSPGKSAATESRHRDNFRSARRVSSDLCRSSRAARNQNYIRNPEEPAMQQPAMNPLPSVIFFVVAIWLIAKSPKSG